MSERNYGGTAFPLVLTYKDGMIEYQAGMSLRDYFAAKAMQALLHGSYDAAAQRAREGVMDAPKKQTVCHTAYAYADAMLAERDK